MDVRERTCLPWGARAVAALTTVILGTAAGQAQSPGAYIPMCTGLTLVTAVNDSTGDYESIKTIESTDAAEVRLKYTTQKMDYGDMFSSGSPKLRHFLARRVVRQEDIRTSRAYLQEFDPQIPESVPGMTAVGTSTAVLDELKKTGEAEFGISHWVFPVPPNLNPEDPSSIYRKQMRARAKLVERTTVTVLVNGVPTPLPAIRVAGNFIGYQSELWFLDQRDNPLTLKFRIGLDEIKPLSDEDKARCVQDTKHLGYLPQYCTRPDGGARSTLDLVKIGFRCGAGSLPTGSGGTGARPGVAAAAATGKGSGSGHAAGSAGLVLDAGTLEKALADDGRVEVPDIFFTFNSDQIREESQARLNDVADVLARHPEWKIRIEGHTDNIAADDYNLKLSQRRAAAVQKALIDRKIAAARLSTEGLGETRPRAPNDTLAGRARNRRVELVRQP